MRGPRGGGRTRRPKVMPGAPGGDGLAYAFSSPGLPDERSLQHPPSPQRAGAELRARARRSERRSRPRSARSARSRSRSRPWSAGARSGPATPTTSSRPHCHQRVLAKVHQADGATIEAAVEGRGRGAARLGPLALRGPGGGLPQGGRPARHGAPAAGQRRHHAGAEQDRLPGRDRQRLRADRLPPVQRALRRADLPGAAGVVAGDVEPDGPPAAGRIRLRHHAVQLHRDRRQPADRAGAHGQRGGLEARRPPRRSATGTSSSCSRRRDCRRA